MTITNKSIPCSPALFLHGIPSNRADQKTVLEWLRTRIHDPEITENNNQHFEISNRSVVALNDSDKTTLLTDALKEIRTWLEQQYCFSEDPQQVKSNHSHLLLLLEVNLLHIKKKLKAKKKEASKEEKPKEETKPEKKTEEPAEKSEKVEESKEKEPKEEAKPEKKTEESKKEENLDKSEQESKIEK